MTLEEQTIQVVINQLQSSNKCSLQITTGDEGKIVGGKIPIQKLIDNLKEMKKEIYFSVEKKSGASSIRPM